MNQPAYPPHPPKLQHCRACDAYIFWQWQLAMNNSNYADDQLAVDEHEPRIDSRWDDVEEQGW